MIMMLIRIKIKIKKKPKIIIHQDCKELIPKNNVLIANENEKELQQLSNTEKEFDAAAYFSCYVYTNQLLLLSHQLNEEYQNTISDICVQVLSGPNKKASRIIEKSETKYRNQSFPVAAKVLDTLRCWVYKIISTLTYFHTKKTQNILLQYTGSVVFNEPKDLSQGIKGFIQYVNDNDDDDDKQKAEEYYGGAKGKNYKNCSNKKYFYWSWSKLANGMTIICRFKI